MVLYLRRRVPGPSREIPAVAESPKTQLHRICRLENSSLMRSHQTLYRLVYQTGSLLCYILYDFVLLFYRLRNALGGYLVWFGYPAVSSLAAFPHLHGSAQHAIQLLQPQKCTA